MSSDKKPSRLRFILPSSITKLFSRTDRQRRQLLKDLLTQITIDFQHNEKKFTNAQNLIEALIKSLELDAILNLKLALNKKQHTSPCVTIERVFNQTKKITAYNLPLHIVCCKIWRWPELVRVGDIESSDYCANQYANARNRVCINPYHYDKRKIEITKISNASSSGLEPSSTTYHHQSTEKLSKKSLAKSTEFLDKAPTPKCSKKNLYMSCGVREYKKPSAGNKLSSRRVKHYESDATGVKITFGSSESILSSRRKLPWTSRYPLEPLDRVKSNFGSYDSILSPGYSAAISGYLDNNDLSGFNYHCESKANQASSEYSSGSMASSDDYLAVDDLKNNDSLDLLRSLNSIPDYVSFVQGTGFNPPASPASIPSLSAETNITGSGQYVANYQNNLFSPASTTLTASSEADVESENNYSPLTENNFSLPDSQLTKFQLDNHGVSNFFSSFEKKKSGFTSDLQGFDNQNSKVLAPPVLTNVGCQFDGLQSGYRNNESPSTVSSSTDDFASVNQGNSYNPTSTFMGRMPRNVSQSNDELNSGLQDNDLLSTLSSSLDLLADPSIELFPHFQSSQLQSTAVSNNFGYDENFNNYQNKNDQSIEALSSVASNFTSEFYYDAQGNIQNTESAWSDVSAAVPTTSQSRDQGTVEYEDDNNLSTLPYSLGSIPAFEQEFEEEIKGNQRGQSATSDKWHTDNENNNLTPSSSEVSMGLTTQALPQKIQQWAHINYFEFSTRVGELFPCNYSEIIVDGSKDQSTFNRFSLGNVETFDGNNEIEEVVGKGVLLTYEGGNLGITCLSDSSIFIQSINYNCKHKIPKNTVLQLETGQTLQVFNNSEFTKVLGDKVSLGYHAVYELVKMCTIRLGFADRWGPGCQIEDITSIPRWIEIYMQEPRKWLDRVLIEMENPDDFEDLLP